VERPLGRAGAAELAAEADRLMAAHAHRHVVVVDDADGSRVAPGFADLGWDAAHLVYMAHRRAPDRAPEVTTEEAGFEDVASVILASHRAGYGGMSEETARALTRFTGEQATVIGTRFFLGRAGGEPTAYCELYVHDGVAQIEDVNTLAEYRGRGLARGVVCAALEAAETAGADLIFLCADDDDWPKHLYSKLGFDPIGHFWAFIRPATGG
jgi:ribosomal protein S18 acetylase RimI-like enzyme